MLKLIDRFNASMKETTPATSKQVFHEAFVVEHRRARRRWRAGTLPVICMFVSACGGGGGITTPAPEPPPKPPCISTADYGCISSEEFKQRRKSFGETHKAKSDFSNQWGLAAIKADQAYAHLQLAKGRNAAPGKGVTVGLIDTGIDTDHPLFVGQTIKEIFYLGATDEGGGTFSHGTAVASVVAANPNSGLTNGFQGVAWGADLKMFAIPLGIAPPVYTPLSLNALKGTDKTYATLAETVFGSGLDILNLSFGFSGIIENYTEQDIRDNFGRTITALAQKGTQEKTILVWAASNDHGRACTPGAANCVRNDQTDNNGNPAGSLNASSPGLLAGLVARIEELRGHSIAAAAVDRNGDITSFSNRCGIVADWCLAAPGDDVNVAYFGPSNGIPGARGTGLLSGTSFAAPMISGGLAIIKQLFRGQLSNTALVTRLFATADKSGKFANRTIYGQGMMNLGAATAPVGEPTVALGHTVDRTGVRLQGTHLSLGGAFGDGLGRSLAGQEIAAFDSMGAPFWFKLADFTGVVNGPMPSARLREFMASAPIVQHTQGRVTTFTPGRIGGSVEQDLGYMRIRFDLRDASGDVERGHFALAQDATTLTLTGEYGITATALTTAGLPGRSPTSGASLSWRPANGPVGIRTGWLTEQETLLGTRTAGAFGKLSGQAVFTGIETNFNVGAWRLAANAEIGTVAPRLRDGLVAGMSNLTTSAFALRAKRRLADGGTMMIALAQPLRVENGLAALSIPVGRTRDGDVVLKRLRTDLVPSGRQVEVSAQWNRPLADGELRFGATWTHNPGHDASTAPALRVLAGWRFEF